MKLQYLNLIPYFSKNAPISLLEAGHETCNKNYLISRANSPIYAFEYIIKGENSYTINNKQFLAKEGDIVYLPKFSNHTYKSTNQSCEKIWFVLDGNLCDYLITTYLVYNEYLFKKTFLHSFFEKIVYNLKSKSHIEIFDEFPIIFHNFLIQLNKCQAPIDLSIATKIKLYLDKRVNEKLSLDEIALHFGFCKNSIINMFNEEFGISPIRYLNIKKIEVAKTYLETTKYSIKTISAMMGFIDEHYFCRFFKSALNCTPSIYRKFTQK